MRIDHIALPARDPWAAARFLNDLLTGPPLVADGPEGEFVRLAMQDGSFLLYAPADTPASVHLALRLERAAFDAALERVRARGIAFGNDPDAPENGEWRDDQGEYGRIYLRDPDGHFLELVSN